MKFEIFSLWVQEFNEKVAQKPDRKVALLLENVSGQGTEKKPFPSPSNVEIVFFPANTTPRLQPLDFHIIFCIKSRYWRRNFERALGFVEEGIEKIYDIDTITFMRWLVDIWENIPS